MTRPQLIVEVAWSLQPLQPPGSDVWYTNISAYVLDDPPPTLRRGRQSELDTTQAGRLTLTLDNNDRRFDPEYASGPYYGSILPRKRIRVRAVWNSVSSTLFVGFIDTFVPSVRNNRDIVTLTASDPLAYFARQVLGGEVVYDGTAAVSGGLAIIAPIIPRPGNRKVKITSTGLSTTARVDVNGAEAPGLAPWITEVIDLPAGDSVVYSTTRWRLLVEIRIISTATGTLTIEIDDDFPAEVSNWAIDTVLNAADWPDSERTLSNGQSLLQSYSANGSALSLLQQITLSENGALFATRDGKIRFDNRQRRLTIVATDTYDDNGATAGLPYADIRFEFGERFIYNDIRLSRAGGSEVTARDQTSIGNYWWSSLPARELLITSDSELSNAATWLLEQYKAPATRVAELRLNGELNETVLWPKLLGAELQDVIAVKRSPPGGGAAILKESVVESIHWTFGSTRWDCRWMLSPSLAANYWRLGVSQLGSNTRLPY